MLWHLEIGPAPEHPDLAGKRLSTEASEYGIAGPWTIAASRGFLVEGDLTQDDLARTLSVLAIRLTEQAAWLAVESPEHAKMAEEVIVKARQVLRKPTWWEPTRRLQPKSDPGNTF